MCNLSSRLVGRRVCGGALLLVSSVWWAQGAPPQKSKTPRSTSNQPVDKTSSAAGKSARSSRTSADRSRGAIPHEAACRKLAARIEESLNRGDPQVMNEAVDTTAMMERALRGIELPEEELAEIQEAAESKMKLGQVIAQALGPEGSYKFLRVRADKGRVRMLFRMLIEGDSAFNYHDCLLRFDEQGRPKIADFYTYATGETISAELRRRMLALVAAKTKRLGEATPFERDFVLHLKQINQFEQYADRNHTAAIQAYHQLPDSIQASKFALTMWMSAAMRAGETDEYRRALEAFGRFFPGDPATMMHQIDLHLLNKQFDQALGAIDALDRRVEGDPYLDVMRASVEVLRPEARRARRYAEAAIRREPELIPAHVMLVSALLVGKDFDKLPRALDALRKIPGAPELPVETGDGYAEFRESPAYRRWRLLKQNTRAL